MNEGMGCKNEINKIRDPKREENTEGEENSPDQADEWPRTPPRHS
jgi:hypothetical protein